MVQLSLAALLAPLAAGMRASSSASSASRSSLSLSKVPESMYLPVSSAQDELAPGHSDGDIIINPELVQGGDTPGEFRVRVVHSQPRNKNSWLDEDAEPVPFHGFKMGKLNFDKDGMPTENLVNFVGRDGEEANEFTIPTSDFDKGVIGFMFSQTETLEAKSDDKVIYPPRSVITVSGKAKPAGGVPKTDDPMEIRRSYRSAEDVSNASPAVRTGDEEGSVKVVAATFSDDGQKLGFSETFTEVTYSESHEGGRRTWVKNKSRPVGRRPWEMLKIGEEYQVRPGTTFKVGGDTFRIAAAVFTAPPPETGLQDDGMVNYFANMDQSDAEKKACVYCLDDSFTVGNPGLVAMTQRASDGFGQMIHCSCLQSLINKGKTQAYNAKGYPVDKELTALRKAASIVSSDNELYGMSSREELNVLEQAAFSNPSSVPSFCDLVHGSKELEKRFQEQKHLDGDAKEQMEAVRPGHPKSLVLEAGQKYAISVQDRVHEKMKYMDNTLSKVKAPFADAGLLMFSPFDEKVKERESALLQARIEELAQPLSLSQSEAAGILEEVEERAKQEAEADFVKRLGDAQTRGAREMIKAEKTMLYPSRHTYEKLSEVERENLRKELDLRSIAVGMEAGSVPCPTMAMRASSTGEIYTGVSDATKMHKIIPAPYIVLEVTMPIPGETPPQEVKQTVFLKVELDQWYSLGRGGEHDFKFNTHSSLSRAHGVKLKLTSDGQIMILDGGETFGVGVKRAFDATAVPNRRMLKKPLGGERPVKGPVVNPNTGYSESSFLVRRVPGAVRVFQSHGYQFYVTFKPTEK